jgi:hypothetical protein
MTHALSLTVGTCLALLCATTHPASAQEAPPPADSRPSLQALLARYEREPSVGDVVRAALASQKDDPEHLSSMARRARLRGLVPQVDLGARRGQGFDLRPTTASADVEGVRLSTDDDLVLQASLRFELGRLMFADEEVSIAREDRSARSDRDAALRQIVELYFKRKRLLLERDAGRNDIDHEVRIAEAEALLDAFTNGAFQRMMAARRTP